MLYVQKNDIKTIDQESFVKIETTTEVKNRTESEDRKAQYSVFWSIL